MKTFILLASLVLSSAAGDVLLTRGMKEIGDAAFRWDVIRRMLRRGIVNPSILGGIFFLAVSFFSFLLLLARADLSYVMPLAASSSLFAVLGARFILQERISARRWAGVALVIVGSALVSITDGACSAALRALPGARFATASARLFGAAPVSSPLFILRAALSLIVLASIVYSGLALFGAALWTKDRRGQRTLGGSFTPPVSILVPVCGLDKAAPDIFACLCGQDYPAFEIIVGVRDEHDRAVPFIRKLIAEQSSMRIELVVSSGEIGSNAKVSNLHNMLSAARHDVLVMLDSDIRVAPDYLRRVVAPLQLDRVGLVTCLYRGVESRGIGALIENIGIAATFAAEVVTARALEGMRFALGSTIAMRKGMLERIGGFRRVADYLADDYHIGRLVHEAGFEVVLSDVVVEHVSGETTLAAVLKHQLRWGRSTRVSRPKGYVGLVFTHATAASALLLAAAGFSGPACALAAPAVSLRLVVAWICGVRMVGDTALRRWIWLVPLRDGAAFLIWIASFAGDEIHWRGVSYRVFPDGTFHPIVAIAEP